MMQMRDGNPTSSSQGERAHQTDVAEIYRGVRGAGHSRRRDHPAGGGRAGTTITIARDRTEGTDLGRRRIVSRRGSKRMHDVMAGHVESGYVPGLVTLLSRRGETHVDVIGTTAFESDEPMRRDTHLPHRLGDQTDRGRGGDDPGRGGPAAPRRPGRSTAAGAGQSPGVAHPGEPARRHRARQPADHVARLVDLPAGVRGGLRSLRASTRSRRRSRRRELPLVRTCPRFRPTS